MSDASKDGNKPKNLLEEIRAGRNLRSAAQPAAEEEAKRKAAAPQQPVQTGIIGNLEAAIAARRAALGDDDAVSDCGSNDSGWDDDFPARPAARVSPAAAHRPAAPPPAATTAPASAAASRAATTPPPASPASPPAQAAPAPATPPAAARAAQPALTPSQKRAAELEQMRSERNAFAAADAVKRREEAELKTKAAAARTGVAARNAELAQLSQSNIDKAAVGAKLDALFAAEPQQQSSAAIAAQPQPGRLGADRGAALSGMNFGARTAPAVSPVPPAGSAPPPPPPGAAGNPFAAPASVGAADALQEQLAAMQAQMAALQAQLQAAGMQPAVPVGAAAPGVVGSASAVPPSVAVAAAPPASAVPPAAPAAGVAAAPVVAVPAGPAPELSSLSGKIRAEYINSLPANEKTKLFTDMTDVMKGLTAVEKKNFNSALKR